MQLVSSITTMCSVAVANTRTTTGLPDERCRRTEHRRTAGRNLRRCLAACARSRRCGRTASGCRSPPDSSTRCRTTSACRVAVRGAAGAGGCFGDRGLGVVRAVGGRRLRPVAVGEGPGDGVLCTAATARERASVNDPSAAGAAEPCAHGCDGGVPAMVARLDALFELAEFEAGWNPCTPRATATTAATAAAIPPADNTMRLRRRRRSSACAACCGLGGAHGLGAQAGREQFVDRRRNAEEIAGRRRARGGVRRRPAVARIRASASSALRPRSRAADSSSPSSAADRARRVVRVRGE